MDVFLKQLVQFFRTTRQIFATELLTLRRVASQHRGRIVTTDYWDGTSPRVCRRGATARRHTSTPRTRVESRRAASADRRQRDDESRTARTETAADRQVLRPS